MGKRIHNLGPGEIDTLESLRVYIQNQGGLDAARGLEIRRLLFDLSRRGLDGSEIISLERSVMRLERAFAERLSEDVKELRRRECLEIIDSLIAKAN